MISSKPAAITAALEPQRSADSNETWQWLVPTGFEQGLGIYGGLALGVLVRAIELANPDRDRTVRSIAGEIPAPVKPGKAATIILKRLRRGNAVTTTRAELWQEGDNGEPEIRSHVVAVLAAARPNMPHWQSLQRPTVTEWEATAVAPIRPPLGPAFGSHFEFRVLTGIPYTGSGPHSSGYIRPVEPVAAEDRSAAYLTALADAWWPCILPAIKAPRPTATLTFSLNLVGNCDGLDPAAPFLHTANADTAGDGYSTETRYLWGSDGRLLTINHQMFVIIK